MADLGQEVLSKALVAAKAQVMACRRRKSIRRKEMPCRQASNVDPDCCPHCNLTRTNFDTQWVL